MRILANDGISEEGLASLISAGYQVDDVHHPQDRLAFEFNTGGYEILLVRSATKVTSEFIESCPALKMVARAGVGTDNIDKAAAAKAGVKVINTPQSSSDSVAELVIGQMFAISRSLHDAASRMKNEDFKAMKKAFSNGTELRGKKLGIIGFGRIGKALAEYALGIGMEVLAVDLNSGEHRLPMYINGNHYVMSLRVHSDLKEILPLCDYVSVHMPLQENGDSVISFDEIEIMKDGVVVVNAARGGVINEDALLSALESGKVAAAALDVFDNEPNPDERLTNNPRIFCTPHIGAGTIEAQTRIGLELSDRIIEEYGEVHANT